MIKPSTIFTEDNLPVMRGMDSNSVDLIYLDPPFNSNRHYEAPIGSKAAGAAFRDAWTFEDTDDAWWGEIADREPALYKIIDAVGETGGKGNKAYLIYMAARLLEMRRILKPTGNLCLHCDPTMSHALKMTLDAIFGNENFKNEIIWSYKRWTAKAKKLPRTHDIILFYGKSRQATFNPVLIPNVKPNPSQYESAKDLDGKTVVRRDEKGNPIKRKTRTHIQVGDVWDIPVLGPISKERTGYPTQKPLKLLQRIVSVCTDEGGTVLDPFCGCATTCVAAQDMTRKWIGIDVSPLAADLVKMRMEKELGIFSKIIHRTDLPRRSDKTPRPSADIKHTLFGKQRGLCNGCQIAFPFQNFTRDHIVPIAKGGSDTNDNLQLLCGRCNSIKGHRDMSYLVVQLKKEKIIS